MTIEPWGNNQLLLRYENIFEKEDSLKPSQPTIFNLKRIFDQLGGIELRETTLDGNEWLSDMHRLKFDTENVLAENNRPLQFFNIVQNQTELLHEDFNVALYPMQIRTFILKYRNRK